MNTPTPEQIEAAINDVETTSRRASDCGYSWPLIKDAIANLQSESKGWRQETMKHMERADKAEAELATYRKNDPSGVYSTRTDKETD